MRAKDFFRELGHATLVGLAIYLVFLAINYFSGREIILDRDFMLDFLQNMVFCWLIYLANALVIIWAMRRYGYRVFRMKRFGLLLLANTVVSLLAILLANFATHTLLQRLPPDNFLEQQQPDYYGVSLLVALVVAVIFYAFHYYKYRQENRVKEQKIIAGTASAQFDALKNQLDPHFLFNSLNVLTSLIDEDPDQAQRFTTGLSKVYRYVLEQKNKELVPIDEEFAFARTYVSLLKMRFEDSIVFDIPEQSAFPDAQIVPLSLQLLLENAVKHNVVTPARPLRISVQEEAGSVRVVNNLQKKEVVRRSSGFGLHNIRQRYALLTDRVVRISETASEFRVELPMLTRRVAAAQRQEDFIADKRYKKARARVEAIKNFYGNLGAYCLVIPFLAWLNYNTTDFPWIIFPTLGWGFGVVMHGMEAYGYNPLWGKRWEERKIRELMEKDDF